METVADFTIDIRGAIRWLALLKITRLFREMNHNQTVEVKGVDPDTRSDLLKILPEISYEILTVQEDADASCKIHLRKRELPTGNHRE